MITTVPITVTGGQLSVNAAIRGGLQVELLDAEGNVWPGFERENSVAMAGDALEHTVSWLGEASLARLVGQPVSLRFYLKAGDLYSFELR